jgi:putative ABC transport system permease protein
MIKHLFKMIWNRKRSNLLITIEIFFSFLVLFAVILLGVYSLDSYLRPLGFNYENVWDVQADMGPERNHEKNGEKNGAIDKELLAALREFDDVESAAAVGICPYSFSTSITDFTFKGRQIVYYSNQGTDTLKDTLGLNLVQGRWFDKTDDGAAWSPIVVNQKLARELFGDEDPIGKNIASVESKKEIRVVGVITDFRKDGELRAPVNYVFDRADLTAQPLSNLVIKVRPGAGAVLQEKINLRLQAIARNWSFRIRPVAEMRESIMKLRLTPLIAGALVAGFLLIMVALGLTGVLWQNVTQRTMEIGLRRAHGARSGNIYRQILGELVLIASLGLIVGSLVVVQFPLLDLIGFISNRIYFLSLVLSLLLIYGLTLICGLYPSRLATRVQPAEALHYE